MANLSQGLLRKAHSLLEACTIFIFLSPSLSLPPCLCQLQPGTTPLQQLQAFTLVCLVLQEPCLRAMVRNSSRLAVVPTPPPRFRFITRRHTVAPRMAYPLCPVMRSTRRFTRSTCNRVWQHGKDMLLSALCHFHTGFLSGLRKDGEAVWIEAPTP